MKKYTKKYVKQANAWGVFWEIKKDKKVRGYNEFFATAELADKFIKEQNEIQTKEKQYNSL